MPDIIDRAIAFRKRMFVRQVDARRIRKVVRNLNIQKKDAGKKPVILFNASTRLEGMSQNAGFSLITSWALRMSGTRVIHFVCKSGMKKCVLGTNKDDADKSPPCRRCIQQSRNMYWNSEIIWYDYQPDLDLAKQINNLDLSELTAFEYDGYPLGEIVLPSLRWILRRHHLEDNATNRQFYREYILSAWNIAKKFSELIETVKPEAVVVFNGMFYPEAMAKIIARNAGIRTITHEVSLQPLSAFFTYGEATAYPIDIPDSFHLSTNQNAILDDYLDRRFQGDFSMAGVRFWPEIKRVSQEFLEKAANFQQIVPVFTNVVFDTSQGHANVIVDNMFEWLDVVLEIIISHPETLFVLRAHPDELRPGKESQETVAGWVEKTQAASLPNVIFYDAQVYISSYDLIKHAKLVMVYNSTIGLEASVMGAAVLCGGKARFTQIPTVFYPHSVQEYLQRADEMLAANVVEVPEQFRINARRFLYSQLFIYSLPFYDFLKSDGIWNGYVSLKNFQSHDLHPKNSATVRSLLNGILEGKDFTT